MKKEIKQYIKFVIDKNSFERINIDELGNFRNITKCGNKNILGGKRK